MDNGERLQSFAAALCRAMRSQAGRQKQNARVRGQVRCQVTYRDTPRVRALRFAIADVRPSHFHSGTMERATDSPERVQRSSYSRLKVSRSIRPLAERYARLRLWNCLLGCRTRSGLFRKLRPCESTWRPVRTAWWLLAAGVCEGVWNNAT